VHKVALDYVSFERFRLPLSVPFHHVLHDNSVVYHRHCMCQISPTHSVDKKTSVCLSVYLSIHPFARPSIYLPTIYPPTHSPTYLSMYLFIYLYNYLFIYLQSINQSIFYQSIYLSSINKSINQSTYLSINQSINVSIYFSLSVHPPFPPPPSLSLFTTGPHPTRPTKFVVLCMMS